MSTELAEGCCAIQTKLDAVLRNSINQDKAVAEKTVNQVGTRVDFAEPHRKKTESTPLPQIHNIIGSETVETGKKLSASNSTIVPRESNVHANVALDAMTLATTWKMMSRTLEAFATSNTESSERRGDKSKRPSKNQNSYKMTRMVA